MSLFDQYAERYKDEFAMEREEGGILLIRQHTDGGEAHYAPGKHSTWGWAHMLQDIGNDPENEVIIITATGDTWLHAGTSPHFGLGDSPEDRKVAPDASRLGSPDVIYGLYESHLRMMDYLINGINVPTIGAVNGPAPTHTEHALACDITLCTEDTLFCDAHISIGLPPGDGLGMSFQEVLGTKRAAYYLLTGDAIDAETALAYGLVNEVLPKDQLIPRALEIARRIVDTPRLSRRMATQIVRRPWRRRFLEDASFHNAHEQIGAAIDGRAFATDIPRRKEIVAERWQTAINGGSTNGFRDGGGGEKL